MKRIKKVIRTNFPETNSSSSHSVVICTDKGSLVPFQNDKYSLHVRNDGTLFIPGRGEDFGWEYEKYNSIIEKLWYVCGIIFKYEREYGRKKRKLLIDILKKYTGAKKVIFEWEEKNRSAENYDPEDIYSVSGAPEIDHNSSDIFQEIIESRDSIKNFIFNSRSWLFLGNDNSSVPDGFYDVDVNDDKGPEAIASIEFGGDIGRVDVEIKKFPGDNIINTIYNNIKISNMYYDNSPGIGKWGFANKTDWSRISLSVMKDNFFIINTGLSLIDNNTGNIKITWTLDKLVDIITSTLGIKSRYNINYDDPIQKEKIDDVLDKNKDMWISLPVTITTTEFGKL